MVPVRPTIPHRMVLSVDPGLACPGFAFYARVPDQKPFAATFSYYHPPEHRLLITTERLLVDAAPRAALDATLAFMSSTSHDHWAYEVVSERPYNQSFSFANTYASGFFLMSSVISALWLLQRRDYPHISATLPRKVAGCNPAKWASAVRGGKNPPKLGKDEAFAAYMAHAGIALQIEDVRNPAIWASGSIVCPSSGDTPKERGLRWAQQDALIVAATHVSGKGQL